MQKRCKVTFRPAQDRILLKFCDSTLRRAAMWVQGSGVTKDYRQDRVRVYVDDEHMVVAVPRIGWTNLVEDIMVSSPNGRMCLCGMVKNLSLLNEVLGLRGLHCLNLFGRLYVLGLGMWSKRLLCIKCRCNSLSSDALAWTDRIMSFVVFPRPGIRARGV